MAGTIGCPTATHAQLLVGAPLSDSCAWGSDVIAGNGYGDAENNQPVLAKPALNWPLETAQGKVATSPLASSDSETELAKRVAALEETIRQLKAASPTETLPTPKTENDKKDDKEAKDRAASDRKDAAKIEEWVPKKIDTITKPTFTPLGRFYFDGVTYSDDPETKAFFNTDRENEFGFRTFRLGGRGNIYENLIYTAEVDLRGTNSAITYKDIYMEQQELPWIGHLRAGHFKEPLGLEEFESDLFLNFMEKSPATQAFDPSRNFGVMAWDTTDECQDTTWFAGIFRADSPDSPTNSSEWRSDNNDWCFDMRLAWLPYYDEPSNGRYLVHLGGSYSFRHVGALTPTATYNQNVAYSTLNGLAEFSTRSWVGSQGPIGFGAEANSDEWNQINSEFLAIWGAASIQSEFFQLFMNSGEQYNGGYTFLSYFLTGENRSYRKDLKVVDRTQPFEPFYLVDTCEGTSCGWGLGKSRSDIRG